MYSYIEVGVSDELYENSCSRFFPNPLFDALFGPERRKQKRRFRQRHSHHTYRTVSAREISKQTPNGTIYRVRPNNQRTTNKVGR